MLNSFRRWFPSILLAFFMNSFALQANATVPVNFTRAAIPKPEFSTPVTLEEVQAAFCKYSSSAIVEKLMENNHANWNMILSKVEAGDADWIHHVLYYISPGTDAGSSTDVRISLAHALPNNPEAVLAAEINGKYPLVRVCDLPFIEPEYAFIVDYGNRTLAALRKVNKPELLEVRNNCEVMLKEGLANCEKIYKEGRW